MPDKLITASVLLPQETKHSGTSDAEKGTQESEETAEKTKTKLPFIQGDVEPKPLGMWVLRVPW